MSAGSANAQQVLYTVQGNALRQVTLGGGDTSVGTLAGSTEALAVHPSTGMLYYVVFPSANLYMYDRVSNINTLIGSTGLAGGGGSDNVRKLGFGADGTLYLGHPINTDDIYTVNLQTGALTFFGETNLGITNNSGDLAVFGNTLYFQVTDGSTDLYTIDISGGPCGTPDCLTATLLCNNAPTSYGIGISLSGSIYYSDSSSTDPDIYLLVPPGSGTNCSSTEEEDIGNTSQYVGDLTNGILLSMTPVTLSHFHSSSAGSEVNFTWSTATEMANVGFHIYEQAGDDLKRLNEQLIPSQRINSDAPLSYEFKVISTADTFFIADIDLQGQERRHGPFQLGESYGKAVEPEYIDWAAVRREHAAKSAYAKAAAGNAPEDQLWAQRRSRGFFTTPDARLSVSEDGLYRVSYDELKAAGVNLRGVRRDHLTLTGPAGPVGMHVGGHQMFGPGSYIVFHGEAVDSLYTRTQNYTLSASGRPLNNASWYEAISYTKGSGPSVYEAVVTHERQREYAPHSPSDDPWFDTRLLAYTSPVSQTFNFNVTNLAGGEGRLDLEIWGVTDWPLQPDHHAIVELNGTPIADERFDGLVLKSISVGLPHGLLREGANSVKITLPGDTGAKWDVVDFDGFTVRYPREMVAENGRIEFDTAGGDVTVDGFPTPNIVAYGVVNGDFAALSGINIETSALGYQVSLDVPAGSYFVAVEGALAAPGLEAAADIPDITSGQAEYLIISHPHFLEGLEPFVTAREAAGYGVKVIDVEHVYLKYSNGTVAPAAIRDYIAHAVERMGTEYVLLVGGDSYDYLNYTGVGSLSFIPTPYTDTGFGISFGPSDSLLADTDGDLAPNVALGRWPVRNDAELASIIEKTLAYPSAGHMRTAVFAADKKETSSSFAAVSDQFIAMLPGGWDFKKAYIDDLGLGGARDVLLSEINRGVAFTSFFGHSGPTNWTYDGLFNNADATGLTNAGKPTIVSQWGCWNTYYVSPAYNTMAHHLLLSGDRGAAATWGAGVLTQVDSEQELGGLVMSRLFEPGMTIGKAIQSAKSELAQENPDMLDVLLGWSLLGDPTIEISQ